MQIGVYIALKSIFHGHGSSGLLTGARCECVCMHVCSITKYGHVDYNVKNAAETGTRKILSTLHVMLVYMCIDLHVPSYMYIHVCRSRSTLR